MRRVAGSLLRAPRPPGPATPAPLAVFSWGYSGWGSSLPELLRVTEAAERSRGFEPPVFVDVRFSRSVRAAGFRERAFEQALPEGRYRWLKGLGNEGIATGGGMRIHRPAEAATLLDLALAERARGRRLLFFCSCASPAFCHRNAVRGLLLQEAKMRRLPLEVAEWPGGEPLDEVACTLTVTPSVLSKIFAGAPRIPIAEDLALGTFAALAWGSYVELTDGVRRATASVGPAQYSAGKWFVTPFVGPIEEGDEIEALAKAVEVARRESHYEVFRGDGGAS